MTNLQLLEKFYTGFQNRDFSSMNECYHPHAEFQDPVFDLQGKHVCAMWHMLVMGGKETKIQFSNLRADETSGEAHWEAQYPFGANRRPVHNIIDSRFIFQDGKILRHHDIFNSWKWATMALGPAGLLLGWSGFMRKKIKAIGTTRINEFLKNHPEYRG